MKRIRFWLIRLLGVKTCGSFGGMATGVLNGHVRQRWCLKPFGHSDSCFYELLVNDRAIQPGFGLRQKAKGYDF